METESLFSPHRGFGLQKGSGKGSFFSRWLFKSSDESHHVGAALENLGNTCFVNAILQCITHTVPLVQKLRTADHLSCSGDDGEFCSFCALKKHVEHCLFMSGRTVSPTSFAFNLKKISASFELGCQEDAHEFLRCLLDSVHSCCLDCKSKDCFSSLEEDSLVKQVFGGRLRSQLRCCECGHTSDTYEPLLDLSLELDHVDSLIEALESFTKVERIEDADTMLTCEGCRAQVSMEKQFKLEDAPTVIAFHLKRFHASEHFIQKIHKFVEYPLELDLRPFQSSSKEEQLKYELYAVVEHMGSFFGGHYVSAVRSSPSVWHLMDDDEVTAVSQESVLDRQAYILFYVKQGAAPWFSSLMKTQKIANVDRFDETSPVSVLNDWGLDPFLPSIGEASCSTSGEMEKDDECSLPTDASLKPVIPNIEKVHTLSPARSSDHWCNDSGADKDARKTSMMQANRRTTSDHCVDDVFHDELSVKDEDVHIPFVQDGLKEARELGKAAFEARKVVHLDASVRRLVQRMPSSRRLSLMSCIHEQHHSISKMSLRRSLTNKIQPLGKRRRQIDAQLSASKGGPDHSKVSTCTMTPMSGESLGSQSIRRDLFPAYSRKEIETGPHWTR